MDMKVRTRLYMNLIEDLKSKGYSNEQIKEMIDNAGGLKAVLNKLMLAYNNI